MWLRCTSRRLLTPFNRALKHGRLNASSWSGKVAAVMPEAAGFQGVTDRATLQEFSHAHSDSFWAAMANHRLTWTSAYDTVQDCDLRRGKVKWFVGGKLNVSVNCLDRHVLTCPDRVALIWERDEPGAEVKVTYRELLEMTCRLGNLLRRRGVKKGDCVTIYISDALAERIRDANSSTVITVNQGVRGGKMIDLKKTVDAAVDTCPNVRQVFVAMRTETPVVMKDRDVAMEEEMAHEEAVCEPAAMDSEDVLFMLYTSGSTGKPKGLVHTQAGYLLYASLTHKYVFDYHDGDVFGCVADIGWITGHSYCVYGPLANGATTVLFESTPIYPDPGRYWETVQRLQINQFYGAPTAIRLLLKYGDQWVHKYDRSSLKTLGSVGEPINTEAWEWYHKVVGDGRCPIVDTWWQTETGGICIAPRPSDPDAEIVPGMAMRPFFGIKPVLVDNEGEELTSKSASGALCIAQPWPGMARTIHNNHQRFIETYCQPFPGYFFTGDGASRTEEGYYQITGRLDDVINVSGHRIGTAEIEDNHCSAVAESAVIGYTHDIKGQGVYAFVVLKKEADITEPELRQQLKDSVSKSIAKYASPDYIQIAQRLPKTRSGKIMRRVLRNVVERDLEGLGDLSTLDDPTAVQEIIQGHQATTN
uniref:Propionate--CoA ligase n=1 Tax=Neogobius melanostomus TaxID=47308 RepID=A0A8C6SA76_9GOBI